jgi:type I restriction enzyme S subunit
LVVEPQPTPATATSAALSERWRTVRFGEVVRNANKQDPDPLEAGIERYVGLEHLDPGSLHIRKWGLVEEGTTFTRKFSTGQVLFPKRRVYQRKVGVAEFDGVCSGDILVFEAKREELLPELLPFIVESEAFFEHALRTSAGSLSPRTRWRDLARYEFPLPPKDEQRRIAAILWAADQAIEGVLSTRAQVAVMNGGLKSAIFQPTSAAIPGCSFDQVYLGSILRYASDGPFGSKLKTQHYSDQGARVIRLQNVGEGVFLDDDQAFIPLGYYSELASHHVETGDVIVAGLGDETHPVGRACRVPSSLGPAVNKADCFCLRADPAMVDHDYLVRYLNSEHGRHQVRRRSQGTTRLRVNVSNLLKIPVLLPDKRYQAAITKILAELEDVDSRLAAHHSLLKDAQRALCEFLLGQRDLHEPV